MTELERLLSEFVDAWNAGERPDAATFLERAPADERDELASSIEDFLEVAPTPPYSDEALGELMRDPALLAGVQVLRGESGLWPSLLPRLRQRARLRRDQVVAGLVERLNLRGREEKTARYLHELETGTLPSAGVSRRVIQALAQVLGASPDELERAGDLGGLTPPAPAAAFLRLESSGLEPIDEEVETVAASPTPEEWDEVDELFRGGRD